MCFYVESSLLPGGSDLTITGHIGEVMQESAQAARSYLWSRAESMGLDISLFKRNGVHIHVPEGAIPKGWSISGRDHGDSTRVGVFTHSSSKGHRNDRRN